jgi:CRP/FNR family transcriptional regulator, cyclic AMP receptor protein
MSLYSDPRGIGVEEDAAEEREFGACLTEREWAGLAHIGRRRQLATGAPVFLEGTRSDTVVLVISGRLKVFSSAEDGTEVVLGVRGPGALLGELSTIDNQPRSASVSCMEDAEVLIVGAREFITFLHDHPQAMWLLLRILAGRLREADHRLFEFGVYDTLSRVARRLVELAERFGEPTDAGIRITLPITQGELAGWVGASREAVAKALRVLRSHGCLRTKRRTVTVVDIKGLRRRAL